MRRKIPEQCQLGNAASLGLVWPAWLVADFCHWTRSHWLVWNKHNTFFTSPLETCFVWRVGIVVKYVNRVSGEIELIGSGSPPHSTYSHGKSWQEYNEMFGHWRKTILDSIFRVFQCFLTLQWVGLKDLDTSWKSHNWSKLEITVGFFSSLPPKY